MLTPLGSRSQDLDTAKADLCHLLLSTTNVVWMLEKIFLFASYCALAAICLHIPRKKMALVRSLTWNLAHLAPRPLARHLKTILLSTFISSCFDQRLLLLLRGPAARPELQLLQTLHRPNKCSTRLRSLQLTQGHVHWRIAQVRELKRAAGTGDLKSVKDSLVQLQVRFPNIQTLP